MMEYLCLHYVQKFSLLTEALSAALFSVFRTLKEHAHVVSIIDSLRGILVIFVPLKNACAHARVIVRGTRAPSFHRGLCPAGVAPVLRLRLFPASIRFALLRTLLAEVATQLRELGGVRQAIAESGVDASASLSRTKRESACPDSLYMQIAQ